MAGLFAGAISTLSSMIASTHYFKTCKCVPCGRMRDAINADRDDSRTINCECGFVWHSTPEEWGRRMSYYSAIYDTRRITLGHLAYGFMYYLNNIGGVRYRSGTLSPEILYAICKIANMFNGTVAMSDMATSGDIDGLRNMCSALLRSNEVITLESVYDIIKEACKPGSRFAETISGTAGSGGGVDASCLTFHVLSLFSTYIYLATGCGHEYYTKYPLIKNFTHNLWTYEYALAYHARTHNDLMAHKILRGSATTLTPLTTGEISPVYSTAQYTDSYTKTVSQPISSYKASGMTPLAPLATSLGSSSSSSSSSVGSKIDIALEAEKLREQRRLARIQSDKLEKLLGERPVGERSPSEPQLSSAYSQDK